MERKLLDFIKNDVESIETLIEWLDRKTGELPEPLSISGDVSLSPSQFAQIFIEEIHINAQWLLKIEAACETPRRVKVKSSSEKKSNTSPRKGNNSTYNGELKTPNNNTSPKKYLEQASRSADKKFRPRLQLFTSPQKNQPDFPKTPASGNASAPCISMNSSEDSFNQSAYWGHSFSPGNSKSWNRSFSGSVDKKQPNLAWQNRSIPEEPKGGRSKMKLSLGDFVGKDAFTPKGKGRRIKPTKVACVSNDQLEDNPFTVEPLSPPNREQDRLSLKKDCQDVLNRITEATPVRALKFEEPEQLQNTLPEPTRSSTPKESKESLKIETPPSAATPATNSFSSITYEVENVTDSDLLLTASRIFARLLQESYCENLSSELYFLVSLLVAKKPSSSAPEHGPFNALQNCAYFAAHCLSCLQDIIFLLSSSTLSMLASNPAIASFVPDFRKLMEAEFLLKQKTAVPIALVTQDGNVSFQCDTDNLENFTSHLNFTQFRKQRDGLYQILQKWEQCHNDPGWDFQAKLGAKVRAVIAVREDPTNLMHLARLLRNQLLASCSICSPALDDAGKEVLELLPSADRDRLALLEARMKMGPVTKRGPAPPPSFPGRQEFFREFIKACGPGTFLHFLQLCLVDELLRLNDMEFSSEATDGFADDHTAKRYFECVSSCCLLAKFLAFAEFLPYLDCDELTEQIVKMHRAIRSKILPLFDISKAVGDAITNGRLTLTIPWVVCYLSLMDKGSVGLAIYQPVWSLLSTVPLQGITSMGKLMIQLCLGYLKHIVALPALGFKSETIVSCSASAVILDKMAVVSEAVLYHVCPYLSELNLVLAGTESPSGRHIRPTPTTPRRDPEIQAKQLQMKLEENFLKNQSSSTRKSIQFVVERVSSCCVKTISMDLLPRLRTELSENYHQQPSRKALDEAVNKWENMVRTESHNTSWETCRTRVAQALLALLGADVAKGAMDAAIDIACRQAHEIAMGWVLTQALSDSGRNEFKAFLSASSSKDPIDHYEPVSIDDAPHLLSDLVIALREANILALQGTVTSSQVNAIVVSSQKLLEQNLPLPTERGLFCLLADLLVWLVALCPEIEEGICTDLADVVRKLQTKHRSGPLERVFSLRTIYLIRDARNITRLASFLKDNGLLTEKNLLQQISNCRRYKIPNDMLDEISRLISDLPLAGSAPS